MNRQDYVETMKQVHAPSDLFERLKKLNREQEAALKKKVVSLRHRQSFYKAASVAAALIFCLVTSNAICYAATGRTWIQAITMYADGVLVKREMYWTRSGNTLAGTLNPEGKDGALRILVEGDGAKENPPKVIYMISDGENALVEEGDRIYLSIANGIVKLDITEDMADKRAEGSFVYNGDTYHYQVEGGIDDYQISTDFVMKEHTVILSPEEAEDLSVTDTEDIEDAKETGE